MQQLTDFPGLATSDAFFERAYRTDDGQIARVRFRPAQIAPAIAANVPVAPQHLAVLVSVSLVGEDGQVLMVAGRALLREATGHTWHLGGSVELDPEAWLTSIAETEIAAMLSAAAALRAAASLIAPVPPATVTVEAPNP